MVIGNGMIAKRFMEFSSNKDMIIFASGVSNSKEVVEKNFLREYSLLSNTIRENPEKVFIYFSTCSIADTELQNAPYILHKKKIEEFINQNANNYFIFRISNVAGTSNNPYTLLNNFYTNILQDNVITVWKNAYRNIIDLDDMYAIVRSIIAEKTLSNKVINIANKKNYSVPFIISTIEAHLNKKARYNIVERGHEYNIDITDIEAYLKKLNIGFPDNYLEVLLKKYYHSK